MRPTRKPIAIARQARQDEGLVDIAILSLLGLTFAVCVMTACLGTGLLRPMILALSVG